MVLDTSQQLLSAYSEEGLLPSVEDLGHRHRVYWPHQIRCFEAAGSAEGALPSADVYVAEYLGQSPTTPATLISVPGSRSCSPYVSPITTPHAVCHYHLLLTFLQVGCGK
jgi:hypothetical protein